MEDWKRCCVVYHNGLRCILARDHSDDLHCIERPSNFPGTDWNGPGVKTYWSEPTPNETRRDITELVEALAWCSGADDFQEGQLAEEGWRLGPARLLARMATTYGVHSSAGSFREDPARGKTPPFRKLVEPHVIEPGEPIGGFDGWHNKEGTRVNAFRRALRRVWSLTNDLDRELRAHGVTDEEIADFSGHTKDILMALGLEWSSEAEDYVFRPLRKKGTDT